MRQRRDPWKWPVTITATCCLVWVVVFVVPPAWFRLLLGREYLASAGVVVAPSAALRLLPPLELAVAPEPAPEPPAVNRPETAADDPRWWRRGWAIDAKRDPGLFRTVPASRDTVALVLRALGLGADFMTRARPDSVLAVRLTKLRLEDALRYDELKPYLTGLARSKTYADILSRAADLYDEPLAREIQVPD